MVAGSTRRNTQDMGFNELMIHEERMRKMREAEQVTNRERLVPNVRTTSKRMDAKPERPRGPDPKPQRPETPRDDRFQPSVLEEPLPPPANARIAEGAAEAVGEGSKSEKAHCHSGAVKERAQAKKAAYEPAGLHGGNSQSGVRHSASWNSPWHEGAGTQAERSA